MSTSGGWIREKTMARHTKAAGRMNCGHSSTSNQHYRCYQMSCHHIPARSFFWLIYQTTTSPAWRRGYDNKLVGTSCAQFWVQVYLPLVSYLLVLKCPANWFGYPKPLCSWVMRWLKMINKDTPATSRTWCMYLRCVSACETDMHEKTLRLVSGLKSSKHLLTWPADLSVIQLGE